jgi:hypothetical protein
MTDTKAFLNLNEEFMMILCDPAALVLLLTE